MVAASETQGGGQQKALAPEGGGYARASRSCSEAKSTGSQGRKRRGSEPETSQG